MDYNLSYENTQITDEDGALFSNEAFHHVRNSDPDRIFVVSKITGMYLYLENSINFN